MTPARSTRSKWVTGMTGVRIIGTKVMSESCTTMKKGKFLTVVVLRYTSVALSPTLEQLPVDSDVLRVALT